MKVFEIKGSEIDWVYGPTKEEALKEYLQIADLEESDLEDCAITEIARDQWSNYTITNPDEYDENGDFKVLGTFESELKELKNECGIIATTAY